MNKKDWEEIKTLREKNSYLQKQMYYQKRKASIDLIITAVLIIIFVVLVFISIVELFEEGFSDFFSNIEAPYILVLLGYLLSKELNRYNLVLELEKEYYYNCLEIKKVNSLNKEEIEFMNSAMTNHTCKDKIIKIFKKSLYFIKFN